MRMAIQFYVLGGLLFALWLACLLPSLVLGVGMPAQPAEGPRWVNVMFVGQQLPGLVPGLLCFGIGRIVQLLERLVERSVGQGDVIVVGKAERNMVELLEEIRDRLERPRA